MVQATIGKHLNAECLYLTTKPLAINALIAAGVSTPAAIYSSRDLFQPQFTPAAIYYRVLPHHI